MPDNITSAVASHAARELSSSTLCASHSFPNTTERTEEESCNAVWKHALYNGRSGRRSTEQSFCIIRTEGDEEFYTVELSDMDQDDSCMLTKSTRQDARLSKASCTWLSTLCLRNATLSASVASATLGMSKGSRRTSVLAATLASGADALLKWRPSHVTRLTPPRDQLFLSCD